MLDGTSDLVVNGTAEASPEGEQLLREATPDLIVVNIGHAGMIGIEYVKHLVPTVGEVPVLVVSQDDDPLYVERALQGGARGYLTYAEVERCLVSAIRRLLEGHVFLSDRLSSSVLLQHSPHQAAHSAIQQLSDRELEVFEYLGRGCSTRQIAESLQISPKTVESHRGRIKHKLSLRTSADLRREAALWARQHHLN